MCCRALDVFSLARLVGVAGREPRVPTFYFRTQELRPPTRLHGLREAPKHLIEEIVSVDRSSAYATARRGTRSNSRKSGYLRFHCKVFHFYGPQRKVEERETRSRDPILPVCSIVRASEGPCRPRASIAPRRAAEATLNLDGSLRRESLGEYSQSAS